jgi:hypothetical protein
MRLAAWSRARTSICGDANRCVIAPFVSAPGNRNESPLLREARDQLRQ